MLNSAPIAMANLINLPDLCLLSVFDRVPLHYLVHDLPLVCRRWYDLIRPSALARRRSLRVNIAGLAPWEGVNRSRHKDDLNFARNAHTVMPWLLRTFANNKFIRIQIFIVSGQPVSPESLQRLLEYYAPRLVELSLRISQVVYTTKLFRLINQNMPALKELSIAVNRPHDHDGIERFPSCFEVGPILKQLRNFSFNCLENGHPFVIELNYAELNDAVLQHLPTAHNLEHCVIGCRLLGDDLLRFSSAVAEKITKLDTLNVFGNASFEFFCARFSSLTSIKLHPGFTNRFTLSHLFSGLRSLTQLEQLHVVTEADHLNEFNCAHQLSSVKRTNWAIIELPNHNQLLNKVHFDRIFPELEEVSIYLDYYGRGHRSYPCSVCRDLGNSTRDCLQLVCDTIVAGSSSMLRKAIIRGSPSCYRGEAYFDK